MNKFSFKSEFATGKLKNMLAQSIVLGIASALSFLSACKKDAAQPSEAAIPSDKAVAFTAADVGDNIMCTNNANNKLEQFNYGDSDWNASGALRWTWMPTTTLGYNSTDINNWNNGDPEGDPMDVKRRVTSIFTGATQVIVTVGGNLATIARYAVVSGSGYVSGSKIWARNVGAGAYPHAAELIPNGTLAVAAAHGDWVRVYSTSTTAYANYALVGAHGVLWDPGINRLWVIGDTKLTALIVGGTRDAPTLSEDTALAKTIPGNGHDLSAYTGDTNKLWITNSNNVYIYDKTTKVLTGAPGAANRDKVKAVSNYGVAGNNMIVQTRPRTTCTLNTWCTPTVEFYSSAGTLVATRTRTGAAYYKADVFSPNYQ